MIGIIWSDKRREQKQYSEGPDVKLYEYTSDTEQRAYYVISRDDYIRIPVF